MKNYGKNCELVLVEWEDSRQPNPAWQHLGKIPEPDSAKCTSVGWVIYQDKSVISLAPNLGDVDADAAVQASGVIIIPISCVTKVSALAETNG